MKTLKKIRILQYCVTAILPFCLTGCMGIYEGGFECPPGVGVGCKSISDVNTMVNQCSVPSNQYSECRIPDLKTAASASPLEGAEIWYAPRASVQWTVSSDQKSSSFDCDKACPSILKQQNQKKKKGVWSLNENSI